MPQSRTFSIARVGTWGIPLVLTLIVGFGFGQYFSPEGSGVDTAFCNSEYTFLNPQLRCEPFEDLQKKEYLEFKRSLETYIEDLRSAGNVDGVSVYFRDLENGPWFGIQEDVLFSPASLMKLPVLITYYKKAEFEPRVLELEIETTGVVPADQGLPPSESLVAGESYTIDELVRRMIVYSDNTALHVLLAFLSRNAPEDDLFAETLASMGLAKSEGDAGDFLTVKRYASFFRALYNSSYLNKEMSQKALEILTQTTFHKGIDDGVPPGIPVAHKYGIRRPGGDAVQLHDCGVVYHPATPYLICIMTKGVEDDPLAEIIQNISQMVYEEVDSRS